MPTSRRRSWRLCCRASAVGAVDRPQRYGPPHLGLRRDVMTEAAIEEWMAASPVYTTGCNRHWASTATARRRHVQVPAARHRAPPQFMDFRYVVHDEYHGGFILSHCGALMDVEPMGDEVRDLDVSRHRGPDLRRDGHRDEPSNPDPAGAPSSAGAHRPHAALRVDGDHRTTPRRAAIARVRKTGARRRRPRRWR